MAQSRVSAPQDQAIGTRAADLGAWDKLQLGWLDYEVVGRRPEQARSTSARTSTTAAKAQGVVVGAAEEARDAELRRARRRRQAVVVRHRRRLRGDADAPGRGARRHDDAVVPGALEHRGLRPRRVRLRVRRGRRRDRLQGDPGLDRQARRGQRYRRRPERTTSRPRSTCRPTPARRSRCGSTTRPTAPQQGNAGATEVPGIFARRDQADQRRADAVHRRRRERRQRLDADRLRDRRRDASKHYDHYYVASNRTYTAFDQYLQTGPYNFGFPDRPDWVEHFPYQNGLLVSYWDTSFSDNNESQHPGQGEILPIDANPTAIYRLDGKPWRGRDPDLRRAVRAREVGLVHAARPGRARVLHPRPGRPAAVRRPARVLGSGDSALRRQGPARGRPRSACSSRAGRRCAIRVGSAAPAGT